MRRLRRTLAGTLRAARTGIVGTAARPHVLLLLLVVNLLAAWVLAAPSRSLVWSTLDDNLYSGEMGTGASWRYFDTVQRRHPEAVGNLSAWNALFSDEGVRLADIRKLSGPPVAVAIAGLFLFWLNGLVHCGFLATLYPDRPGGFTAAVGRFAAPASAIAVVALAAYVLVYQLLYVETGKLLADAREAVGSEWLAWGMTWSRLGLTVLGFLGVKVLFDLARIVLVHRNNWNWPWAGILALREVWRHAGRYLLLYLLLGLAAPVLVALWWLAPGRFAPQGWIGLGIMFLLQELFLAARIGLRLAHLAAAQTLYTTTPRRPRTPPYKVEVPGRE